MGKKQYTLYQHITPDNKRYIGATSLPPLKRWQNGNGYRSNALFWEAIQRWGWDNITHEIIAEGLTKSAAALGEHEYIVNCKANNPAHGFNKSSGYGFTGCKHTTEARQKISEHRKGKKSTRTYVIQEKSPAQWRIYKSVKRAAEHTGVNPSNISRAARGQRKTAGGFEWRYPERP